MILPKLNQVVIAIKLLLLMGVVWPGALSAQQTFQVDLPKRKVFCLQNAKGLYLPAIQQANGSFKLVSQQLKSWQKKLKSAPPTQSVRLEKKVRKFRKRLKHDSRLCRAGPPAPPTGCLVSARSFTQQVPERASSSILLSGKDSCSRPLSFRIMSQPQKGSLSGTAPQLRYAAGYSRGPDSFTYAVSNGLTESSPATVTISVKASAHDFAGQATELEPYRESLSEAEVRHLLDKAALGGDANLLELGLTKGLSALVEALAARSALSQEIESQAEVLAHALREQYCVTINVAPPGSPAQNVRFCSAERYFPTVNSEALGWLHNLRYGQGLREKMALLWHDHFAIDLGISSFSTERRHYIKEHVNLLRRFALNFVRPGGVKEGFDYFAKAMHFDGAMNLWLDNFLNTYSELNENYGREITELFILGLKDPVTWANNFTEQDILNIVRAFTGFFEGSVRYQEQPIEVLASGHAPRLVSPWLQRFVDWSAFRWMPDPYNPQLITIFPGSAWEARYAFKHDSATDYILASHPGSARYISAKIFSQLVHPQPSQAVVSSLARLWSESAYDIEELAKSVLKSAAMFSPEARDVCVSDPLESLISFARKLDLPLIYTDFSNSIYAALQSGAANAGKALLRAPSVFGWKGCGVNRDGIISRGEAWLGTQNVLGRRNAFISLLNELHRRRSEIGFSWETLLPPGQDANDPALVIQHLAGALNVRLSPAERQSILAYLTRAQPAGGAAALPIEWDPSNQALIATKIPGLLEILANHPSFTLL